MTSAFRMPSIGIGFTNSGFLKNLQPVFQDFSIQDLGIWLVGLLGSVCARKCFRNSAGSSSGSLGSSKIFCPGMNRFQDSCEGFCHIFLFSFRDCSVLGSSLQLDLQQDLNGSWLSGSFEVSAISARSFQDSRRGIFHGASCGQLDLIGNLIVYGPSHVRIQVGIFRILDGGFFRNGQLQCADPSPVPASRSNYSELGFFG